MKPERTPTAKILDAVEEHPRYNTLSKKQNPEGYICFSDGFIAGVRWLESQSSPVESKWVKASERLPEERMLPVLVVNGTAPLYNRHVFQATWFLERRNFKSEKEGYTYLGEITHWQPLPELPPIEETKEK